MKSLKTLIILSLVCNTAFAGSITAIKQGVPAPYEGVLFDVEEANKLRADKLELDFKVKEASLLTQRLDLATKEVDRLAEKSHRSTILGLDSGFVGGILTTILIGFTINKVR